MMDRVWHSEAEIERAGGRQFDLFDPAAIEHMATLSTSDGIEVQTTVREAFGSTVPTVSAPDIVIEDAGAELTYNRRNRIRAAKTWADIQALNDTLKVKEGTKGNFWPKPDYAQLIDDGMQPIVAHIVKQVYDSLPAKPMIAAGVSVDNGLQTYIRALNRVQGGLLEWANDKQALQAWASQNARVAGAMLGRRIALTDLSRSAGSLDERIYPQGWKAYGDEVRILGGNKFFKNLDPGYTEINRAIKAIEKGWPEKREAWQVQGMTIAENPTVQGIENPHHAGSFILYINDRYIQSYKSQEEVDAAVSLIKPYVLFGKRGVIASFDSEEEAIEAAKERVRREKGATIDEAGTNVTMAVRTGLDRRMEGENISSEKLLQTFGFKGVNFGNWLKTPATKLEAQLHLNHVYDAFHDLAEILDVPPKAMSLGGMLGIAIGAQGGGGTASAHFVPGVNEINITRTTGAGFLAHEWAHALDHYFATQAGLGTAAEPYLTEHASLGAVYNRMVKEEGRWVNKELSRFGEVRPEIVEAFKNIVQTMNKRPQTEEEAQAQNNRYAERTVTQLGKWLTAIRRDFTKDDAPHPFDQLADRVRNLDYGDGMISVGRNHVLSPVVVEMRELYKKQNGRLYGLENCNALQSWMNSYKHSLREDRDEAKHAPQMVTSEYAARSYALDKDKGGKKYWSTDLEKFARAFDAFVSDTLEERSAQNTYLSSASRTANTLPAGEERKAINAAFKSLLGELKTRETERGPVMFSLDEYRTPATESENFKTWFGESKVIKNGKPLVVYHGTTHDFSAFARPLDADEEFEGFFFASNPAISHEYIGNNPSASGHIMPAYLAIEKPYAVTNLQWAKGEGLSPAQARDAGFDGYVIKGMNWGIEQSDTYIAFRPEQIKSAVGNNRQFSKDNPNILYSVDDHRSVPSLSVSEIYREVQRRQGTWKGMPEVVVVEKAAQLPFMAPSTANGALQDGCMYLVAENLHSLDQLQKVLAHECVGHYALEEMLEAERFSQLCDQVQALKKAGHPEICAIAGDIQASYGRGQVFLSPNEEAAEIIARSVERCLDSGGEIKVEYAWIKSLYAGVAKWLRDKDFNIPFSNFELQGLIANAGVWVKGFEHARHVDGREPQPGEFARGVPSLDESLRSALPDYVQSLPAKPAKQDRGRRYVGSVVASNETFVAQHIGRELAIHPTAGLLRVPSVGENVSIQYNSQQRGEVVVRNRPHGHTR